MAKQRTLPGTAKKDDEHTLRGSLINFRFRSTETHWTVGTLKSRDGKEHTIVGTLPDVDIGDELELVGAWTKHPKFGEQFKAETFEVVQPLEAEGVVGFLASKLKHIGRRRAESMVLRFGPEGVWQVLEKHPERLVEVPGITKERADLIVEDYKAHRALRDTLVWLKGWRLTDWQASRVLATYGSECRDVMTENPYRLIEEIDGFGWKTVDWIALKMGIDREGQPRARAAVLVFLEEQEHKGDCYQPVKQFCARVARELAVQPTIVHVAAKTLIEASVLVHEDGRLYSARMHKTEHEVAARLIALREGESYEHYS